MTLVHARIGHEADRDQAGTAQVLGMLRTLDAKVEGLRLLLSQHRKETYTVEEYARLVGRSAYTTRRWVAEGKLQAIRVQGTGPRGRLLIPRSELDRLVASGHGGDIPDSAIG